MVAIPLKNKFEVATYQGFQMVYHLFLYRLNVLIYEAKCQFQNLSGANNMARVYAKVDEGHSSEMN